ncbi:MAG: trigger factor [Candidatus Paceibacterota bacterium]|jgi:FKBP-type peptidyl-prolyl cis-trans isomerase (trigger factor)
MKIDTKINKLNDAEIEIEGEISAVDFANFWPQAIKTLGEETKIDGFRPGHIPEKILIEKLGETKILYEMANEVLGQAYSQILTENQIDAIGEPHITITKIAKDNPLGFKIKTATLPQIDLGDYKKITIKTNSKPLDEIVITDEEVSKVIEDLRKQRAIVHKDKENKPEKTQLPELNDDFAKSLGKFENLNDLRNKIKENLDLEKKARAKEKRRLEIVDSIRNQAKLEIPKILIETEKEKMMAEMEHQISQMGLNFDDYLKHLKKTREEMSAGWDDDAKKRVGFSLIISEIARIEKITPPAEELKKQTDFLAEHYKDVDRRRLEAYAANAIVNEKVLQMLEEMN